MHYEFGGPGLEAILCSGFGCLVATLIVLVATARRRRSLEAQDRQVLLRAIRSLTVEDRNGTREAQSA